MDGASSPNILARVAAVGALLASAVALAVVLTEAPRGATASAGFAERLGGLAAASERATAALAQLEEGRTAAPARMRVRLAMEQVEATTGWLEATSGVEGGAHLANALDRHREYLDAVGSALANPRSPLRHELRDRARRLRAAYASVPGGTDLEDAAAHLDVLEDYVAWRRSRL